MNNLMQETPKAMSILEQEVEDVYIQLTRIESSINAFFENFSKFDLIANKLNPEDYFKNQPIAENKGECGNSAMEPCQYRKSGQIQRISDLVQYAKALESRISAFNEKEMVPATAFFERNI